MNKKNYNVNVENIIYNEQTIGTDKVVDCINQTNSYIRLLSELFIELNFNLFEVLGQRNLSGVIGEIFARFFCKKNEGLISNPHPDGRPDILNLADSDIKKYFLNECFTNINGKSIPVKNKLTPFKYSGIEIKCTIGNPIGNYKKKLFELTGKKSFELGLPRIDYLAGFNYWAHHQHATNLLSLYYDYYEPANNLPQLLSASYTVLEKDDWNIVSVGKSTGKKTSNTSLNKVGISKLYDSCICIVDDPKYISKFKQVGIQL